jgi:autotransporter-associated beta strand protein
MKIAYNPFLRRSLTAVLVSHMVITAYADITLSTGQNNIDTTGNPALGVITRSTGNTAWFDANGTATATGTPLANGILGPWASIGTGTGTRYATLDGSNNVVGFTGATAAAAFGWPSGNDATFNYDVAAVQAALGVSRTGNTARYTGGAGTQTWGNSGANVTITLNGLMNAGTGTLTFAKGGTGAGTGLVIGATKELVLNAANAGITISAPIFNNGGGASALTVVGSAGVTLTGANTYSGGTSVNQGTVLIGNNSAFGTGGVSIASGATVSNSSTLSGIGNTVTGSGAFTTGSGQATLTGNWTGFSGTVTSVPGADMVFNGGFSSGVANTTSANAAYVNNYNLNNTNGMIVQNLTGSTVTYKLGSYASAALSNLRNAGSATGSVIFEIGNLNTDTVVSGGIGGGAQTTSLTKVGTGTLTLAGTCNYTGATLVSSGTLLVNGSLGNTAVSVTGGTLGGTGTIAGSVSVSGTATFAPGASIESLSTGSLTMASGSSYEFEVADNSSTGADLVAVNGTLSLTDVSLDFDAATLAALASGSWLGGDKFTLISYSGTGITSGFVGYDDDASYFFGSNEWIFNYNDTMEGNNFSGDAIANGQDQFVTMTLIPEPAAGLLGSLGLLGLLRRRR